MGRYTFWSTTFIYINAFIDLFLVVRGIVFVTLADDNMIYDLIKTASPKDSLDKPGYLKINK